MYVLCSSWSVFGVAVLHCWPWPILILVLEFFYFICVLLLGGVRGAAAAPAWFFVLLPCQDGLRKSRLLPAAPPLPTTPPPLLLSANTTRQRHWYSCHIGPCIRLIIRKLLLFSIAHKAWNLKSMYMPSRMLSKWVAEDLLEHLICNHFSRKV